MNPDMPWRTTAGYFVVKDYSEWDTDALEAKTEHAQLRSVLSLFRRGIRCVGDK
jgi:hypothetical protein